MVAGKSGLELARRGQLKQRFERELTGKETEPWAIIYFKRYQSQMPVIERAIETVSFT
jgi:hypothetical protein